MILFLVVPSVPSDGAESPMPFFLGLFLGALGWRERIAREGQDRSELAWPPPPPQLAVAWRGVTRCKQTGRTRTGGTARYTVQAYTATSHLGREGVHALQPASQPEGITRHWAFFLSLVAG